MSYTPSDEWGSQPASRPQPGPGATGAPPPAQSFWPQPPASFNPPPRPPVQPAAGQRRSPPPPRRRGCGGIALAALLMIALATLLLGLALVGYASIARDLPQPEELQTRVSQFASTLIYDRDGNILNEVGDPNYGRRTAVPLERISPYVRDATIATEDPNFYQHPGVDPVGLARAIYYAIRERDLGGPGGSTITQQLVKLTFLSPERTVSRKVKEAILAAEITRRYPKDTILQIYLNEIYYGNLAYGIEAASETYFGRSSSELSLAQAAMLAGLPQAPAYYDPYTRLWEADGQPGAVKRRQGEVLRLMVQRGYITSAQADAAWIEPLALQPLQQVYDSRHPHFVLYARGQVEQVIGPELASKGGLRIYTTLDVRLQAAAEEAVKNQVAALAAQNGRNGAVVAVRPATGEILALVGSADFDDVQISGQINMALAPRQPGSALKPFVYLATFELPPAVDTAPAAVAAAQAARIAGEIGAAQGTAAPAAAQISAIEPPGYWTPATAIMDIRTEFPDGPNRPPYVPYNYGGSEQDVKEHGLVSLRTALANSYNIPAVKALEHVGLERLKEVARRGGITTLTRPDYGLSLALGGGEVTLLELTAAYATLANGGVRVPVSPIACVLDSQGRLIWRGAAAEAVRGCLGATTAAGVTVAVTPAPPAQAFDPQHAYLISSILSDVEARQPMFGGVRNVMTLPDRPAAVKTGTTNDYRDAWTMGYTPDLAVGVWVGNADYTPMQRAAGSVGAAPIWHGVMVAGLQGVAATSFIAPPGVQRLVVCADSGTSPSEACPAQRQELFADRQGPLPAGYDLWQRVRIDRVTGQLATEFTPADRIETRDVLIFPEQYRAWAEARNLPLLSQQRPPLAFAPELALLFPADGSNIEGVTPVYARIRIPEPAVWRLEYGAAHDPGAWGVLDGPWPINPADEAARSVDAILLEWDVAATAAQHGTIQLALRLAAYYDISTLDYPMAVSNIVRITLVSPTETPTPTITPTPTGTSTPTPTIEVTPTPTATPEITPTPSSTLTPGVTPPTPTLTPEPTPAPSASVRAVILQPQDGARVQGQVEIQGLADGTDFAGYVVEYTAAPTPQEFDWLPVASASFTPVSGGVLAVWPADTLAPGPYWLRLRVFDTSGAARSAQVRVEIIAP